MSSLGPLEEGGRMGAKSVVVDVTREERGWNDTGKGP